MDYPPSAMLCLVLGPICVVAYVLLELVGTGCLIRRLRTPQVPREDKGLHRLLATLVVLPSLVFLGVNHLGAVVWDSAQVGDLLRLTLGRYAHFTILPVWVIAASLVGLTLMKGQLPRRRNLGIGAACVLTVIWVGYAGGTLAVQFVTQALPWQSPATGIYWVITLAIGLGSAAVMGVTCLNLVLFVAVLCREGSGRSDDV